MTFVHSKFILRDRKPLFLTCEDKGAFIFPWSHAIVQSLAGFKPVRGLSLTYRRPACDDTWQSRNWGHLRFFFLIANAIILLLLLFGLHASPQWNTLSYLLKTQALSRRHRNNLWHILFAVTEHWPVIFNLNALIWRRQTNRVDTYISLGDGFYATPASFKKVLAAEGINGLYPFRL